MFKIFVGKNCRICHLYWCFHKSICSKTRRKDLRNCPQHPKRDLSKGDTVWWVLKNCMFLGGQRDTKRWACVWSRVVQICGVLPCLSYDQIGGGTEDRRLSHTQGFLFLGKSSPRTSKFWSDNWGGYRGLIVQARIAAPFFVWGLVQNLGIWAFYHTPSEKCQIR